MDRHDRATKRQSILTVDDDDILLDLYHTCLQNEGCVLLRATNAREALQICVEEAPDLLLVDYLMPGMTGLDLVVALRKREQTRNLPILMITASADKEIRLAALSAGVDDFLAKPVDPAELIARARNLLRLKSYQDDLHMQNTRLEQQVAERTRTLRENEVKISRLTRIYAVLSGINSAIVRIHDRQRLLEEACRIAVAHGAFRSAWIGLIDQDTLDGAIVAASGGNDYLAKVRLTARPDTPYSERPACVAAREARPVICQDISRAGALREVLADLESHGHRSVAAFPLLVDGQVVGVMSLFADEVGFFDEQELKLLNELAGDISFGLQYIEKEERLQYLAYYDPLTGLPNRAFFTEQLSRMISSARQTSRPLAVVVGDITRFRVVNETIGRNAGDELLREAARRLTALARNPERLARVGAASFASILDDDDLTAMAHRVERVVEGAVRAPFVLNGEELSLTLAAGVARYPEDGETAEALFKNAEAAMMQAKLDAQPYRFYESSIHTRVAEDLKLEHKLRRAIEKEEFVLYYQPKVASTSGRTVGLEALLRWNDPETGLVPPVRFISILEETGLIASVGQWVIAQALKDLAALRARGIAVPGVSVNASIHQLCDDRFPLLVSEAVAASGLPPGCLEIEITESLFMRDIETNVRKLEAIKAQGVRIAIDDFGTGYSSLSYLAKLPVHTLKIDRSFIAPMTSSSDGMAIVSAVISLAHALNLDVVAEGVELEEQARFLRLLKCDAMQGYYFGRPVALAELEAQLRAAAGSAAGTTAG
ncbi:MAG TPA: EAL domain-containing protein [Noviherbaspirillum sp.]|uniref:EAL domain-containing response regulator n=1 Tax=Noviherbaspirillum sp. TaxID=1926288 RepID=UPI002F93B870